MPESERPTFLPPEESEGSDSEQGEYVFRFRIGPSSAGEPVHDDPLVDLIRGQLADLLDSVILTDHGRRVRVDGFRLLQDMDTQYDIFPQGGEVQKREPSE